MKVKVDELRCDAHGVCVSICPEVFSLEDDKDVVTVLVKQPDDSFRERVERAAFRCPKAAITIED